MNPSYSRSNPSSAALPSALRSAPAQNALPAPVTTTACTPWSASARSTAARSCFDIAPVTALRRWGSLTVISATRLSMLNSTRSDGDIGHLRSFAGDGAGRTIREQVPHMSHRSQWHLHHVPPAGFEPATTRLEVMCSIQLSYGGQRLQAQVSVANRQNGHSRSATPRQMSLSVTVIELVGGPPHTYATDGPAVRGRRVLNDEEWHDRSRRCQSAILAGARRSAAPGVAACGRADRCVSHRLTAASRLANGRRLLGGMAVCRISSARRHRARAVWCEPAVDRSGCDELGGPARRSHPHCRAAGFLRSEVPPLGL